MMKETHYKEDMSKELEIQTLLSSFDRTVESYQTMRELLEKLRSGRQLRIKYGVDVTAPFLHLGHAVNLHMMRKMQELGHKVVFLIGDFTTRIGDPTGRSEKRPIIAEEDIERNSKEFIKQISSILITRDPNLFEIRRNSEWFGKDPYLLVRLLSMVTHSEMISRDMFRERMKKSVPIYMSELIYPILQGYDSFALKSDLTIVGTDQLFNENMGRKLQRLLGMSPQVVITTKITPGIDGREKQSKSLNNYIALKDSPRDKFGKVMSIPDHLIIPYFEVYTEVPMEEVKEIESKIKSHELNPRNAKLALATAIVERYHGVVQAQNEKGFFVSVFSEKNIPQEIPKVLVKRGGQTLLGLLQSCIPGESRSNLRRLIWQGGITVGALKITDPNQKFELGDETLVIKAGKRRWFQVKGE